MIRFIGDIHADFDWYLCVIKDSEWTFQLGDLGLGFGVPLPEVPPGNHYFIRGNHDNPDLCTKTKGYLGDYGTLDTPLGKLFFVSGGCSVDWKMRTPGVDYWPKEQLSIEAMDKALELYIKEKPDIVISHEGPRSIAKRLLRNAVPTPTNLLLDEMNKVHKPRYWLFGHYHIEKVIKIYKTTYCAVDMNQTVDIGE